MKSNGKVVLMGLLIFMLSFLWIFSLTYNFNYFWEDFIYRENLQNQVAFSPSKLSADFFKILINPDQFYQSRYMYRPLMFFSVRIITPIQTAISDAVITDIFIYRMLESLLFACFSTLIFCFFYKIGEQESCDKTDSLFQKLIKNNKMIISLLLGAYIIVLPEIWLNVMYGIGELLLSQFFATLPLLLFLFYYNKPSLKNKGVLCILFIIIVFFTHISILIKHVGRINFLLIFIFLLFTDRKKILTWRYGSLIFVLLFLSFPLLGLYKLFLGESLLDLIGISSHMGLEQGGAILSTFIKFLSTVHHSFLPHAFFLLLLFFSFFILHLYGYFKKKKYKNALSIVFLRGIVIFSFFWYLLTAASFFIARGFVFDPKYFTRYEFSIFLVPQALFLISYAQFVYKKYFSTKKFMQFIIYIFIILAVLHNAGRLNEWRGGWGAYFLGYDTARKYVDNHAENSVMLLQWDWLPPVYFSSTNNEEMVANLTNSSALRLYQEKYNSVFIAHRFPLTFDNPSIVNVTKLSILDNSPYGRFKKLIGRYYPTPMYLYTVQKE